MLLRSSWRCSARRFRTRKSSSGPGDPDDDAGLQKVRHRPPLNELAATRRRPVDPGGGSMAQKESGLTDEDLKTYETILGDGKFKAMLTKVIAANDFLSAAKTKAETELNSSPPATTKRSCLRCGRPRKNPLQRLAKWPRWKRSSRRPRSTALSSTMRL